MDIFLRMCLQTFFIVSTINNTIPSNVFEAKKRDTQKFINELTMKSKRITANDGVVTFQCQHDQCGKILKSWPAMRKHAATHGPRSFICDICQKAFVENSKLRRHMLVHTGERPFKCEWPGCGKKFSLDFNLKTHMRIHTGDKPYSLFWGKYREADLSSFFVLAFLRTFF